MCCHIGLAVDGCVCVCVCVMLVAAANDDDGDYSYHGNEDAGGLSTATAAPSSDYYYNKSAYVQFSWPGNIISVVGLPV